MSKKENRFIMHKKKQEKSLLDLITVENLQEVNSDKKGLEETIKRFNEVTEFLFATDEVQKVLKGKDKTIADLEAKLEESKNKHLLDEKEWQDYCSFKHIEPQIKGCLDREREYKQQLAMQENTITNLIEDNRASQEWYKKQLAEKEKENELMAKTLKMTKFIEKEVNQDKISFAVAELNKLWDCLYKTDDKGYVIRFASMNDRDKFNEVFNNQIKQLKEGK